MQKSVILNTNTTVDQGEKFISSGEGFITNPKAFTNTQLEEERFNAFSDAISNAQTETETQQIIDDFSPSDIQPTQTPIEDSTNITMQDEYYGQVDPTIVSEQVGEINVKIHEELRKLHSYQANCEITSMFTTATDQCQDFSGQ